MAKVIKAHETSGPLGDSFVNPPLASETVTAVKTITVDDNGKTFFLNSATEFACTLPAPAAGLFYRFIVAATPSGANYTVVTNAAAQILAGQVHAGSGGDEDSEATATATTVTFVAAASFLGDMAELWCDGTNWYAQCFCDVTGGITITG